MKKPLSLLQILPSLLLLWFLVFSLGSALGSEKNPAGSPKQALLKVAPGGKITISLSVILPKGYELSEDPALAVNLDKKALKAKSLTSEKYEYVFKAKDLAKPEDEKTSEQKPSAETARFTLKVSKSASAHKLSIPIKFRLFFCSKENGYCTNAELVKNFEFEISREKGAPSSVNYFLELAPTKEELGV